MPTTSSNILKDLSWPLDGGVVSTWRNKFKSISLSSISICEKAVSKIGNLVKRDSTDKSTISLGHASLNQPRNRFIEGVKRVEFHHSYKPTISPESPYGYFRNRPIIGESNRINGGIFIGATSHEAIVIDEKYGLLEKIFATLEIRCGELDHSLATYEYDVFSKAISLTRESLRFSEEGVSQIEKRYNIKSDDKVTLDLYLKRKVGVSRHQVLLAAFLLERLRDKGFIRGVPTIESQISESIPQERLLFTSGDGEIFRFDPTKGLGKTAIH